MTGIMLFNDKPYVLLIATTWLWAGNAIASRLVVGHASPMVVTSLRWVGTLLIMITISHVALRRDWPAIKANWRWLAVMGTLGFTGFNALFYLAGQHTTAINLGLIQGAIPVMVLAGAFVAYRTPVTRLQALGMVLTLFGVILLTTKGHVERLLGLVFNIGDVYMLIACLGYSLYTVALRDRPAISPLPFFTALSSVALLSSLPLLAIEASNGALQWPDARGWAIIAFIAIGPGFIAQLLFMRGVELVGPGRAGLFVNLIPPWTALMGTLILGEDFAWYHAVALVLVLGGIGIAESRKLMGRA